VGAPKASSATVRRRMQAVARTNTKPERDLQDLLRRAGLEFEIDVSPAGGRRRADIVFREATVAVFVHGCFWHSCPRHATVPKTNTEWWVAKLEANARRDKEAARELRAAGWVVIRVWEHQDMRRAGLRISLVVGQRWNPPRPVTRRQRACASSTS
jgi:DNA mismatch endonuclease, patch repair protein